LVPGFDVEVRAVNRRLIVVLCILGALFVTLLALSDTSIAPFIYVRF
jgi:hypothetical protein